jgi:hypothetical protein
MVTLAGRWSPDAFIDVMSNLQRWRFRAEV